MSSDYGSADLSDVSLPKLSQRMPLQTALDYYLFNNTDLTFSRLRHGLVCGRSEGQLKFEGDTLASRKHCRFIIDGYDVFVEDLGSTNRTKVNGVEIRPNIRRKLRLNDVIEFGNQRMILTNQMRHPPANVHDMRRVPPTFKARVDTNGQMCSPVSKLFTLRTLMIVDRNTFLKMKIREMIKPERLPQVMPAMVPVLAKLKIPVPGTSPKSKFLIAPLRKLNRYLFSATLLSALTLFMICGMCVDLI